MEVIPAIDLRGGRCVRLYQGDFAQETVFATDPAAVARRWEEAGAPRLHVVDLDGAAHGKPQNLEAIKSILKAVKLPVQVGGGIRRRDTVALLLGLGVRRVVLGTAAVETPALAQRVCRMFGEAVIIGIDAREGRVAIRGWQEGTALRAEALATRMEALGARRFIYTDIAQDGTLQGPNLKTVGAFVKATRLPVIASGGVATVQHLLELARLGVEGAIVGQALYTGGLDLSEALAAVKDPKGRE